MSKPLADIMKAMDDKMLMDLFGSLSREIGEVKAEVKDGINRIDVRLARQVGILNGGARQMSRLITWSEDIDALLAQRDARIAELAHRIDKLEGKA
jgi:hypothetical protein